MMLAGVAAAALAGASHAALVEETYTFPLPPMRGGQALFTEPEDTLIEMPSDNQRVAIQSFNGELVEAKERDYVYVPGREKDEDFTPVPLSQLYNHHWVAYELGAPDSGDEELMQRLVRDRERSFSAGPCGSLRFAFGGGSEMRNTPVSFPDDKRYFVPAGTTWGVNLHLIDLRGVAKNETQLCHECNCDYMFEANAESLAVL